MTSAKLKMEIGQKIKTLREHFCMTQEEFADKAGLGKSGKTTLHRVEKGTLPFRSYLPKIMAAFNVPRSYFFPAIPTGSEVHPMTAPGEEKALAGGGRLIGYALADDTGGTLVDLSLMDDKFLPAANPEEINFVRVIGSSMEPIAKKGQVLAIAKREPKKDDMVVVRYENGSSEMSLVKRWRVLNEKNVELSCITTPPLHDPIVVRRDKILDVWVVVGVWYG